MTDRRLSAVALVVLVGHLALGYAHESGLRADDDRLYLYYVGAQLGREIESAPLNAALKAALRTEGATENAQWRFESRDEYGGNYLAPTIIYRAAADLVRRATGETNQRDYPAFMARAMFWGYVSAYLAVCALLLTLISGTRQARWIVAAASAVAAIALIHAGFEVLARFGFALQGGPMLLPEARSSSTVWDRLWPNLPGLLLNPGPPLTPFGDTPRHHFNLLVLAVFLFRWRSAYTASYGLLLGLSFVHQSHTGLLAAYLVATDLILRPHVLVWRGGVLVGITLALFVGRETLGDVVGIMRPAVLLTAAVAVAIVVGSVWLGAAGGAAGLARRQLAAMRRRLLSRGPVAADLAVIGALWLVSFPVAAAINASSSTLQSVNFWRQLHGRSMGMLRPALVLALTLWAIGRLTRTRGERGALVLAVWASALALVPCVLFVTRQPGTPIAGLERALRRLDRGVPPTIDWDTIGRAREPQIYYSLARALEQRRP